MVGVGDPFYLKFLVKVTALKWIFGSNWLHWNEITDFRSSFARSASAIQSTLLGSPLALSIEHKMNIVRSA